MDKVLNKPIIMDNGSWLSKNGFAGELLPHSVFPTLVGYPKYQSIMTDVEHYTRDYYTGEEAMNLRGVLKLVYPVENGITTDWNAMEKIWISTFHDILEADPSRHPVLLADDIYNSDRNREKMVEVMFETFNCPAVNISRKQELVWWLNNSATERKTGLIVDVGDSTVRIVPIVDGKELSYARKGVDIGGKDITSYLQRLIRHQGISIHSSVERDQTRDMKERHCYVALDYDAELKKKSDDIAKHVIAYSGSLELTLEYERFTVPEILFNPGMIDKKELPLHEAIIDSIMNCNTAIRGELFQSIFLCGGSSLFPGLPERITRELKTSESVPEEYRKLVKVITTYDPVNASWIAGSMIASTSDFQEKWITKQDYHEHGSVIVRNL